MEYEWSAEQRATIEAARSFARNALSPRPAPSGFDRAAWDLCAREGIVGLVAPRGWGGREQNALTAVAVLEALGRCGADRGLLFALGAHLFGCTAAIARLGSANQHARWGEVLVDGRAVAALAATEESGGSNVAGMKTLARVTNEGYVVDGCKTYVTNGPVADLFVLIASTNPKLGIMGLTAFLMPRDTPGLAVEPLAPTLGLKGAPLARVRLGQCALPRDAILGRPGGGFALLHLSMQWERTCLLAGFLGAAERDLDAATAFVRGRSDKRGASLYEHQAVSHRLARLRCRLESARWLLYRGAWALDHDEDPMLWPAMVKWTVSETVVDAAMETMRTFAGAGWIDEQGTATALRDVVATLAASGTSDAQLNVVAACLERSGV